MPARGRAPRQRRNAPWGNGVKRHPSPVRGGTRAEELAGSEPTGVPVSMVAKLVGQTVHFLPKGLAIQEWGVRIRVVSIGGRHAAREWDGRTGTACKQGTPYGTNPMPTLIRILPLLACLAVCSGCDFSTGYQETDGEYVYVTYDAGNGRVAHPIEDVDSATFEVLAEDIYAKDAKSVYFRTRRLEVADPKTFVVLSYPYYAKDANRVYLEDAIVRGADPATFRMLRYPYSRDDSRVFCGSLPMEVHDIDSFEVVQGSSSFESPRMYENAIGPPKAENPDEMVSREFPHGIVGSGWARDGVSYYFGPAKIEGADYASFTILNRNYAKDKSAVYFKYNPMPEAHPATFEVIDSISAKDKNHHYLCWEVRDP
jgi:hypothetical protein